MPRTARLAPGEMLFDVMNRGVGWLRLLLEDADFEAIVERTLETRPMRILAHTLMLNHWRLALWADATAISAPSCRE